MQQGPYSLLLSILKLLFFLGDIVLFHGFCRFVPVSIVLFQYWNSLMLIKNPAYVP